MKKLKKQKTKKNLYTSMLAIALLLFALGILIKNPSITFYAINENSQNNFNLEVKIAENYKSITTGENIWFTTKIMNLGGTERMDITLKYSILDEKSNIIAEKSETMAIETQASFVGNLKVPDNAEKGDYNLNVELFVNNNKEAESYDSFKINKKNNKNLYYLIAGIMTLLFLALLIYLCIKSKKIIEKIKIKSKVHNIVKNKLKNS